MIITKSFRKGIIVPSNFDESKKYPLAYLVHGGVGAKISSEPTLIDF